MPKKTQKGIKSRSLRFSLKATQGKHMAEWWKLLILPTHPLVNALADSMISSPIKIQGTNGSKGTSWRKSPKVKKKPAAIKGANRGVGGLAREIEEKEQFKVCENISTRYSGA